MGRKPCCAKQGLNRGTWSANEDKILADYIKVFGEGKWRVLPQRAGLKRCGKSCRLRWLNYLKPGLKRGNISAEEEDLIVRLHKLLGNRWSLIAGRLPGRTDNEIKNYWNTILRKRSNNLAGHINYYKPKEFTSTSTTKDDNHSKRKVDPIRRKLPTTESSHEIIRTKAVRCTKVVIPHDQKLNYVYGHHHYIAAGLINNSATNLKLHSDHSNESPNSLMPQLEEKNSSHDFFWDDFDIEELLNSDWDYNVELAKGINTINNNENLYDHGEDFPVSATIFGEARLSHEICGSMS